MAARLQLKLGIVAEHDRLDDSPDTLVVVEPSVGSVARSKGNLYLLVTSRISSRHALEATRLAAETIRNEYYYDESAGIRVCLQKAIATANKRLLHQADRLGLKSPEGNGPIGVGVGVVRGNEMYVATVGPAEAYLIRQARLSTLPDPHRERGLPSNGLEPEVWRGEVTVGDSLVLISPNIVARLGPDELKDAMVTLHPHSAMEHLHHRFRDADGSGSDGAIAFEATEVAPTTRGRTLVPVRPAEPLAGAPDRSPIPLADNVQAAGAAMSAAADSARVVAGTAFERIVQRLHDVLPRRRPAYRRVTPLASRRETQRRAAIALIALLVVVGSLAMSVWAFGGRTPSGAISSVNAGQAAIDKAKENIELVSGPGIDLITDDRNQALGLLTEAFAQLEKAEDANVSARVLDPIRQDVVGLLDRAYGVVDVVSTPLYRFKAAEGSPAYDLRTLVRGYDDAPYVIDRANRAVFRVDLKRKRATNIARNGRAVGNTRMATPKFLAVGGRDLLILDAKNALWRWRASNDAGKGTTNRVNVNGASQWGNDILAIGTYVRDASRGLYNLYVAHYTSGKSDAGDAGSPGDELLRPTVSEVLVAGSGDRNDGRVYTFDRSNDRLLAYEKRSGDFLAQYRLKDDDGWADLRGMYVIAGVEDQPDRLIWLSKDSVNQAVLQAAPETDGASPSPSAGSSGSPAASASP
jgi:hypothetical protein